MKRRTLHWKNKSSVLKRRNELATGPQRSEVDSQDLRNLWILDLHHPLFLEQNMTADQDQIHLTYQDRCAGLESRRNQRITSFRPSASAINVLIWRQP